MKKTSLWACTALALTPLWAWGQSTTSMLRVGCEGVNADAEITINGKFKGNCPFDAEVQAGTVQLQALKKVDADRERVFNTSISIGEGVVKRIDIVLGPVQLNEAGRLAEAERKRVEAERKQAEADRKRKEAEAAAAHAARQAEFKRLAVLQSAQRGQEQARMATDAFAANGLRAGTGEAFRDCTECPEMVWIPPGRAPQVPATTESQRWYNRFELRTPIAVGKFEVTFDEWDACVAQRGCTTVPQEGKSEGIIFDSKWGRGRQPVINISHQDARQYVAWLSKKTGQRYGLLSQLEYQYASRAGATTTYPWGDRLNAGAANCAGCEGKSTDQPLPVGSFPANAWGLHDMVGNVSEFVADCYGTRSQASNSTAGWEAWVKLAQRPRPDLYPIDQCSAAEGRYAAAEPIVGIAGGSFATPLSGSLLYMQHMQNQVKYPRVGFRIARDYMPPPVSVDSAALAPFQDCADCPKMVKLPSGRFEMGSAYLSPGWHESETPLRWVGVATFAIGRTEVTRGQYAAFVRETQYAPAGNGCNVPINAPQDALRFELAAERGWADPGFTQTDAHPVVCVNRADMQAYASWISQKTGQRYRLPTEAEWEYAARAGSDDRTPWRETAKRCEFANMYEPRASANYTPPCGDGYVHTAPSARFKANAWGLHDMIGNVGELVEDCWIDNYAGAPADASARTQPGCAQFTARGGQWSTYGSVTVRAPSPEANRRSTIGFRLARDVVAVAQ